MLAGMIFCREPFFRGEDNDYQLIKIAKFFWADEIHNYVNKFDHLHLTEKLRGDLINYKKKDWSKYINASN